jgi:hypothetical protein
MVLGVSFAGKMGANQRWSFSRRVNTSDREIMRPENYATEKLIAQQWDSLAAAFLSSNFSVIRFFGRILPQHGNAFPNKILR